MTKKNNTVCGACGRSHPTDNVCNFLQCVWCSKLLYQDEMMSTAKCPNKFYCGECYQKGLDVENEAMYG